MKNLKQKIGEEEGPLLFTIVENYFNRISTFNQEIIDSNDPLKVTIQNHFDS